MNIRPLYDRILVQTIVEESDKKYGSIIIPDMATEKPIKGIVVAVGAGRLNRSENLIPLQVKVGDKVLYSKYGGSEIKVEGEDFLLMREDDILAVIT